jgi:hypothetical protein
MMRRMSAVVAIHHKAKDVSLKIQGHKVDGVEEVMLGANRGHTRRRQSVMVAIQNRHRIRRRISTLWSPDDEIGTMDEISGGTLDEISGLNEALLMSFEVDTDKGDVGDFMADGDLEMDNPENVEKRNALRSDHSVVAILKMYFNTCSGARRIGAFPISSIVHVLLSSLIFSTCPCPGVSHPTPPILHSA